MVNLSALSEVSRKLNEKSDKLNEVIISINEKLEKLNIGVEVFLAEPIEADDPYFLADDEDGKFPRRDAVLLGYSRFDDDWQLAIKKATLVKDYDNRGVEYERTLSVDRRVPLLNASRDIRANAMRLIPALLDLIKSEAEELLQSIEQAEAAAKKL
jgi:hypothetical protein